MESKGKIMSTEELLMDRVVRAYVKKYKLVQVSKDTWHNRMDETIIYHYSEIVDYIGLMDTSEIIRTLKGRRPSNYKD